MLAERKKDGAFRIEITYSHVIGGKVLPNNTFQ
jgi:hypothetical protein